jgi:hypothetical protein
MTRCARVYKQIGDDKSSSNYVPAPEQSAQARQQFAKLERLGEEVVYAGIKVSRSIMQGVARSKYNYRHIEPAARSSR